MLVAIVLAFSFPQYLIFLEVYMTPVLVAMMFFASLKIDFERVFYHLKKPMYLFSIILISSLIFPVLTYVIFNSFLPIYSVGFFLIAAAPVGISAPALARIFKGDVSLALVLTVIQHLLAPFTITFLTFFLLGHSIEIPMMDFFIFLFSVIFLPLLVVFLLEKYAPRFVQRTELYTPGLVNLCMFFLILVAFVFVRDHVFQLMYSKWWVIFLILFFGCVRHFIGFVLFPRMPLKEKIVNVMPFAYVNITLMLVLALEFFDVETILIVALDELVFTLGIVVFDWYLGRIRSVSSS